MSFTGRDSAFNNTEIVNDGFFPNFTLGDFNDVARVDVSINPALVKQSVQVAMAETNFNLKDSKTAWLDDGFNTLSAVALVGAESLYFRAVFSRAKAVLIKEYPTLTRKKEAENTARESNETEGFYIQAAEHALRLLRGDTCNAFVQLL